MTEPETNLPNESSPPEAARTRKNRGIRFADSEWQEIEKLAADRNITTSEMVRQTMVSLINGKLPAWFDSPSSALPPGIQTQIEKIYRATYILATLKRDEMYREGHREELDAVLDAAKSTQEAIKESASDS